MNFFLALFAPLILGGHAPDGHGSSLKILDRTDEPRPLVIDHDTDMSDTFLVDNNIGRPAVIVLNASFKLAGATRDWNVHQSLSSDPGIGTWHDGKFLPQFKITASHNDFTRAVIVAEGSVNVEVGTMECAMGVLVTASPDGTYGKDSTVKIGRIEKCRGAVWATGQENLFVDIGYVNAALWPGDPDRGHAFYANESRFHSEFLRLKGVKVRIGKSRGFGTSSNVRFDNETAKFKGSRGVDYECLDDENPCGAFDQYGSSGHVNVVWSHPGGDAMNHSFTAFRSGGGDGGFGPQTEKFVVKGSYDCSRAPDQLVPAYRWETKMAAFAGATVKGGAAPGLWPGVDLSGVSSGH